MWFVYMLAAGGIVACGVIAAAIRSIRSAEVTAGKRRLWKAGLTASVCYILLLGLGTAAWYENYDACRDMREGRSTAGRSCF